MYTASSFQCVYMYEICYTIMWTLLKTPVASLDHTHASPGFYCLQNLGRPGYEEHGQKTSRRTQVTKLNFAVQVQLMLSPVVSGDGPNGQRNREPKIDTDGDEKLISISLHSTKSGLKTRKPERTVRILIFQFQFLY